jgi:signal transduction histidine kinase/ligand-binding sensor domain-containing protein
MKRADTLRRPAITPLAIALGIAVLCGARVSALDPARDISQYAHTAWFLREGFAQGRINAIAQTPDGYLWLGTEFGLLRFDGVRTVVWHPPDHEQLPDNWIRTLLAAPDGTLWIGTLRGLASWKNGTLTRYPALTGQSVNTILVDREGTIWAGGYAGGVGRVRTAAGTLCGIRKGAAECLNSGFGEWVGSLYEDRNGALWVAAQTGLWRWRPGNPTRYAMSEFGVASSQVLNEGDDGHLLIASRDGIRQLVEGKALAYPLPKAGADFKPERLLRDRDGGLWIGTLNGLVHVHQGRTDVYTQANGLSGDFITRLFEDREGNIWVATKNGLDRFRDLPVETLSTNQGLPSTPPWSVLAARDGSVWLGALGGLSRWKAGQVTTYRTPDSGPSRGSRRGAASGDAREAFDDGLPDDSVGTLFEDGEGRLWVTTLRGVAYFEHGRFVPVSELPAGRTSAIASDRSGNLWIASAAAGLYRWRDGAVVEHIPWVRLGLETPATALVQDPAQDGLWLGLQGRVAFVKGGEVRASYGTADGLGEGLVNDLRFDRSGTLWVATESGLSRIRDRRVATLTSRNGLPCNAVHWSVEDDTGSVWLYTVCGLLRVTRTQLDAAVSDPARRIVATVFTASDGVALRPAPSLYRPQVARTADGKFWFLPGDGVSVLDPRRLAINALPPSVHIEQVTADRRAYGATSGVRLPPRVRDLEIDYTALSLVAPEKNRFRVKLEGRDRDWQDVGSRRQAFYADLAPGPYRFRVAAANNSGVWNEPGAFLDFSIAPAYSQTTWFRTASVITVLALFWALYQFRLRQVAHDFNLRLDERVNERTRIARELHDTLLQSFQGSVFRIQSARDLLPAHPDKAVEALDGALDRADQAIVEGRDAIENLRSSTVVSNELPESIATLAEDLTAGADGGAAMFRISIEGSPRQLHPVVRDDVHRISREALRNAFRHAQANHVEAEVTYGARELRVRIRDDGKGIDAEQLSAGRARHWGLTSMRERAAQISAQLSLWSEIGAGTEVELRIPGSVAYGARGRRGGLFRWKRKSGAGT